MLRATLDQRSRLTCQIWREIWFVGVSDSDRLYCRGARQIDASLAVASRDLRVLLFDGPYGKPDVGAEAAHASHIRKGPEFFGAFPFETFESGLGGQFFLARRPDLLQDGGNQHHDDGANEQREPRTDFSSCAEVRGDQHGEPEQNEVDDDGK